MVKVLDRTTVNTLDLANLGWWLVLWPSRRLNRTHLAADGASVYIIPSPFDGTGVSKLNCRATCLPQTRKQSHLMPKVGRSLHTPAV